ncbi:glycosyltransferase family 2 protein [Fervidobacterium nodosum]|uniref:glycosyltransferase family 2 protein n=1 Tax=Fervidobacterium nodosum TaxID=2424 RepID=UPI0002F2C891|nr:glycosyltransferase [Fervidobacterium nodosum]
MKISVLMPTYNDAKHIGKSIESVLSQRKVDVELIIVNDGSTDETEKIVLSYNDRRIKYIKQENKGQLDALLNGSKFITGDLVCLFHSDDLLTDEFAFKRNAITIIEKNLDGVYSDYVKINEKDEETGILRVYKNFGENT